MVSVARRLTDNVAPLSMRTVSPGRSFIWCLVFVLILALDKCRSERSRAASVATESQLRERPTGLWTRLGNIIRAAGWLRLRRNGIREGDAIFILIWFCVKVKNKTRLNATRRSGTDPNGTDRISVDQFRLEPPIRPDPIPPLRRVGPVVPHAADSPGDVQQLRDDLQVAYEIRVDFQREFERPGVE